MSKDQASNQGSMFRDKNRVNIPVGSGFVTADVTGTPITSPKSLTTTAVFTIVVPDNAVLMTVVCGAAIRVSEVVGMGQYDVVAANTKEVFQVSKMQNIYVCNDSTGTNNLYFKFVII
jgi:hypothetical protein